MKDIATPELLDIYISQGDARPENEHMGRELDLRDSSEIENLLKKETESRGTTGELLMVAIIASSMLDPSEAKPIVKRVAERLSPDNPEPVDGNGNPLIPEYLDRAFDSIERREQALVVSSNLVPTSDKGEFNPDNKTTSGSGPASVTRVEESTSTTPWPVVVALVVGALGLLWLLLKRQR